MISFLLPTTYAFPHLQADKAKNKVIITVLLSCTNFLFRFFISPILNLRKKNKKE